MKRSPELVYRYRHLILALWVVLWLLALVATHTPPKYMPQITISDKALHTVGFFGLAGWFGVVLWSHGLLGAAPQDYGSRRGWYQHEPLPRRKPLRRCRLDRSSVLIEGRGDQKVLSNLLRMNL
jgi:hypothetical protein